MFELQVLALACWSLSSPRQGPLSVGPAKLSFALQVGCKAVVLGLYLVYKRFLSALLCTVFYRQKLEHTRLLSFSRAAASPRTKSSDLGA